ncbi:protein kinase [Streptomyces sp. NPDC093225]|uniref:serine/threonine-protein kinase n=1 Tax=Streptomyces sp. NPDC093225 TaxID=3366034 RepID=UPI00382F8076
MDTSEAGRQLVEGRFELLGRLGSGGMGTVWRARDISLDREVALKEVQPPDPSVTEGNPALAATLRERAVREARAMARLAHPHVVAIHQILEPADGSSPWIVMELVQGGSLNDRLQHGPLPVSEVARIGLDVLSALRAAHSAGVNHRDVKPANVLLRPNGSAVLTDFGIAALRGSTSLTATGDLIGSPEYIAPERIRGEEGHPASDLWSLGMLMYVAAEGAHPLRRTTTMATMVAVLEDPIPSATRSGALASVLAQLLVRDPDMRPDAERLELLLRAVAANPGGSGADVAAAVPPAPAAGFGAATPVGTAPGPLSGGTPVPGTPVPGTPVPGAPGHGTPVPGAASNPYASSPYGAGQFGPAAASPYAPQPHAPGYGGPSGPTGPLGGTLGPLGTTTAVPQPGVAKPPGRGSRVIGAAVAVGMIAGLVTLATQLPIFDTEDDHGSSSGGGANPSVAASRTPGSGQTASGGDDSGSDDGGGSTAAKGNLLTPANIRKTVSAFAAAASKDVIEVTFYEEYAMAEISPKGRTDAYDNYRYDSGADIATRTGPGSTLDADDKTIDLNKVNWDALPGLFKRAEKELNVKNPTMRYVIVDRGLIDKVASMRIYLTDDYGAGYMEADLNGKVTRVMPR